jgi:hypothetical protein
MGEITQKVWKAACFLCTKIWRWDVTIAGSLGIAFAGGMAALYGDDFVIAKVCFFIGIAWITARIVADSEVKRHESRKVIACMTILGGAFFFFLSLGWVGHRKNIVESRTPAPIIEGGFDMYSVMLPINISPGSNIDAVVFLSDRKGHIERIVNTSKSISQWPFTEHKSVHQMADTLKLWNHSNLHVFNLVVPLTFEFKSNVPGGNNGAATISSNTENWRIDEIGPGESAVIYFVDETRNTVITSIPETVSMEIEGKEGSQTISITRRHSSPLDVLPMTSGPSLYDWSGKTPKPLARPAEN